MRSLLLSLLLLVAAISESQAQFNNEWIDYSKTYYKFFIASPGIYRISKSQLDAAGIGSTPVQHFQLWKNGQQVPLFTSVESGQLGNADFVEFFGQQNDGTTDRGLYRIPTDFLDDKRSLFTDTAAYFLTINPSSANARINLATNNAAAMAVQPMPNIWKLVRHNYKNIINGVAHNYVNRGLAVDYGEDVYSSAFEAGEMMSSGDIFADNGNDNSNKQAVFGNLQPYTGTGLSAKVRVSVAGSANNNRNVRISINGTTLYERLYSRYQARIDSLSGFSISQLSAATTTIGVSNLSTNPNDRIVAGFAEIDYPRLPDAGNTNLFDFYLPPMGENALLEIANFNHGNQSPILFDISTNQRMLGIIMPDGKVRFSIAASAVKRQFWLVANNAATIAQVGALFTRNYAPLTQSQQQGNYLIVASKQLTSNPSNATEQFRQYRSSAIGGGYNAKIYYIDELVDQFAFGIKMHPLAIKNFLRFARNRFSQFPQYCFLIGKGVTYDEYRFYENHPQANNLQLIPTFGYPASDVLLASEDLTSNTTTAIGRLNAISNAEVLRYLDKVKQYESAQANTSDRQADKAWMKNVVHVIGANDAAIESIISPYMANYKQIIEDTLMGGRVTTFNKFSSTTGAVIENELLESLFEKGFSQLTYFGHSSATALDYNLDDPGRYNNAGKYPVFLLNGCNAGNFFTFDTTRLSIINTISEKYILAENRGAICMIASTHFGIVNGLNEYSNGYYQSIASKSYNQSVGRNMRDAISYLNQRWGVNDFLARIHTDQQTLHGDPAIKVNAFAKPDYSIEAANININPSFLSIAETNFKTKIFYYNIGKAITDSVQLEVTRKYPVSAIYPNGFTEPIYKKKVKATLSIDSLELTLPIISERDKGINIISVTIDGDNKIAELSENNNNAVREFVIFEDELRPVFPYNYSIVTNPSVKLVAATSNPFSESLSYRMELDTTQQFNSSAKVTRTISAKGGIIEFDAGITLQNTTVYYWRLGIVRNGADPIRWNNASFVYIPGTNNGYNQSHFYQHTNSTLERLNIDSTSRIWNFNTRLNNLFVLHGVFDYAGPNDNDYSISLNNSVISASFCVGHSMVFNVFDPINFKPWRNHPGGLYGSGPSCDPVKLTRQYNFEWDDRSQTNRKLMMDFMDAIPNGHYVMVRKVLDRPYELETYVNTLKADENTFGSGNSLYHRLKNAGFAEIDSFNKPSTYIFLYKKNDRTFTPVWRMSENLFGKLQMNENAPTPDSLGFITSPMFGPAAAWKEVLWDGKRAEQKEGDAPLIEVIGVNAAGAETVLQTLNETQKTSNISSVNVQQYPYMRLRMRNLDTLNGTPYQLNWWRIYYTPVPEGALAPNVLLQAKDTFELGEPLIFKIAFKNISEKNFDSLKLKAFIIDRNNVTKEIAMPRKKPLAPGDTTAIVISLNTKDYQGVNTLYLAVNPDNDQPEQFFFNNFLYKGFFVREDKINPLLDVTFDGARILNRDIVSAKPHIQVKLKDESQFLALNDTAGLSIKLKFPGESNARNYRWGTDTLQFVPAIINSGDNTATVDFYPTLDKDTDLGGEYELTVSGKDRNGNRAGNIDYKVSFSVINKPMISNLLNYPNPFSTSTAFVFTITGFEIPQEFKIQVLTVTGKIVKEITKQELGPIRIGTNITEYKWDGTDTYGQKLANGVYLYRVVTSLNGQQIERLRLNDGLDQSGQDVTDQFFNKGYGKMVILR